MSTPAPTSRNPPGSLGATFIAAFSALFANLGTVLPVVIGFALLGAFLDNALMQQVFGQGTKDQSAVINYAFASEGMNLTLEIFLGPIIAAVAVYVGRCWLAGQRAELYKTFNFALGRYKSVFLPHMFANILIHLGMLILVPGILYMLQYAFVDSVACIEKNTGAMGRSKRLTRGRRKRLILLALPAIVLSQVIMLVELGASDTGVLALAGTGSLMGLITFLMAISFFMVYAERTTPRPEPVSSLPEGLAVE